MKILASLALAAVLATPAAATTLRITITNDQAAPSGGEGGFALTPVYTAFHNGDFDAFTVNEAAPEGLRELAEVGNFGPIRDHRVRETTDAGNPSAGAVFSSFTPSGDRRPLFGGESATVEVDLTNVATQRYFTFLSMVIPTNDLFIGNDDPFAYELFDAAGNFTGDRTISITGAGIYDAGTEVNWRLRGVAFSTDNLPGFGGATSEDENGVVTAGFDELDQYVGLNTAGGFSVSPFTAAAAAEFQLATIRIEQIAPIPVPGTGLLLLGALGAAGAVSRRASKRAA